MQQAGSHTINFVPYLLLSFYILLPSLGILGNMAFLPHFLLLYVRLSKHWNLFQDYIGKTNLVAYHSNGVNRALNLLEPFTVMWWCCIKMIQHNSMLWCALMTLGWGQKHLFQQEIVSWWGWSCTILVLFNTYLRLGRSRTKYWPMEGFLPITVLLACTEFNCLSITVHFLHLPYIVIHYL